MAKRAAEMFDIGEEPKRLKAAADPVKKHTLDSDEEDSGEDEDRYNIMDENEFEGEEDGIPGMDGEVKITPFNMKEELEEGHFDKEGHFQWDKSKEIKDNWLDNIDWIKVKTDKNYIEKTNRGLADSSDSEDELPKNFNEIETYKEIVKLMQPGETIKKTLQRLGSKTVKLSSVERWKRKKAGIVDENAELVTKFTELTNNVLTEMGNMDIYQETYEQIQLKIKRRSRKAGTSSSAMATKVTGGDAEDDELDMYADDFEKKEKSNLVTNPKDKTAEAAAAADDDGNEEEAMKVLNWEYKWKDADTEIHGPFTTEQMLNWSHDGYFKDGVVARKVGEDTNFYSSNRIDFDLYL